MMGVAVVYLSEQESSYVRDLTAERPRDPSREGPQRLRRPPHKGRGRPGRTTHRRRDVLVPTCEQHAPRRDDCEDVVGS